jgi:hypothetical protein
MPLHSHRAHSSSFSCSICNEFVELETAKSDEFGQPVHEECYAQQISLKRSIRPPPEAADAKRNYVSESIRTFLTIVEGRAIPNFCSVCGSRLEHRKLTFFFEGQARETSLSTCLICDPIRDAPPYDA